MSIQNICCSIKSKKEPNVRCSHPTVHSSEYCGIHINAKTLVRFVGGFVGTSPKVEIPKEKLVQEVVIDKNKKRTYSGNESQEEKRASTLIQSVFRGWNIRRRSKPNNIEDCGTLERLLEVPIEYYIQYQDATDNLWYGFDIRTLESILESKHPVNPYNTKDLKSNNKLMANYAHKKSFILDSKRKMSHDSPKLTESQRFSQFAVRVFQKFDELGQYTDTEWFTTLSIEQLKHFYHLANDMFDYRAQLTDEMKKNIVKNGLIFHNFKSTLSKFRNVHTRILQVEILREMERVVDEGVDKEFKILGMNLILSALVEVSHRASLALPHLVQSTFFTD
jgi:hypothetical protein